MKKENNKTPNKGFKIIGLKLCLLALLLGNESYLNAQNTYRFQSTTSPYTDLVGATVIPWTAFDQSLHTYFLNQLIGETFYLYKLPFVFGGLKTFAVETAGTIRIDNDSSTIIIDAAFTYMDSIDTTSSISYLITGTPGNYIVKAQWKNLKLTAGPANNFVNLQIWVYQQTGVVEIHYGNRSANNASGYNTTSGPQIGMFYSKDNFTHCYEKLWVRGTPNNIVLDSIANYNFYAMTGIPDSGTTFRFTPRFIPTEIQNLNMKNNNTILFPNPASDFIKFNLDTKEKSSVEIYSATGEKVIIKQIKNNDVIPIANLSEGIYLVKITSKNSDVISKQIQIIK